MCDQRLWAPVRTRLDNHFSTVYLAIESQVPPEGTLFLLASAADPAPLHLVAFSMVGYLPLDFALEHPDRVGSLVAVGSSAFGLTETEKAGRGRALELLARHDCRGMETSRLRQFVHPSHWTKPEVVGLIRAMDCDLGKETLIPQLKETSALLARSPAVAIADRHPPDRCRH